MSNHNKSYFAPHITVATVVQAEGKYLLVEEMVNGKLTLNQPAGHLEKDESIIDAAKRELLEETGLTISPQALIHIYQWQAEDLTPFIRFTFVIDLDHQPPVSPQDSDICGYQWLTAEEILQSRLLRSPLVKESLLAYQKGIFYPLSLLSKIE